MWTALKLLGWLLFAVVAPQAAIATYLVTDDDEEEDCDE